MIGNTVKTLLPRIQIVGNIEILWLLYAHEKQSLNALITTWFKYENESQYWRKVLHRIVSVVQFLRERGLAFRGKDEVIGSASNGVYLGILELNSNHDTFLAKHIQWHANKGLGHTSYLSSTVCEEVIELMGHKVMSTIINEIKRAKYYISVDSTPDAMHVDQLTVIIRYVLPLYQIHFQVWPHRR